MLVSVFGPRICLRRFRPNPRTDHQDLEMGYSRFSHLRQRLGIEAAAARSPRRRSKPAVELPQLEPSSAHRRSRRHHYLKYAEPRPQKFSREFRLEAIEFAR